MSTDHGVFVISLDLELYWGLRDHSSLGDVKGRLRGVRPAVRGLLDAFEAHKVHATWATVGMLFADGREQLQRFIPQEKPTYRNRALSPYHDLERCGGSEADDPFHFGRTIIQQIQQVRGQEIGSHTFSHYYCREAGQTQAQFDADTKACKEIAASCGCSPKSLVFPRNQVNWAYLSTLSKHGIRAFRSNPRHWSDLTGTSQGSALARSATRGRRFIDSFAPLEPSAGFVLNNATSDGPIAVPASMFLRPWSPRLGFLNRLRVRRIKREMTQAAIDQKGFHLWWHPHNFGTHLGENLGNLNELLAHFGSLRDRYGMKSQTLQETAELMAS